MMENSRKNDSNNKFNKDKAIILLSIKTKIEKGTGLKLLELKKEYSEEQLFFIALKHITTTKKALCSAINIPIEAACRYKRDLEKRGVLMQSLQDVICPYTRNPARLLSTNPAEFDDLNNTDQLSLFSIM